MSPRAMDVSELHTVLSENNQTVLVVDCRPFLKYNLSHVCTAHNIHCPPIVKRRSGGSLPIENIIRCAHTRRDLLAGTVYSAIVVYDDATDELDALAKDSNMALVLKSLADDTQLRDDVFFLSGGFEQFSRLYPQLTVGSESSSSMDSSTVTTPSSSLSQSPHGGATDTIRCHPGHDQGDPVEILPYLFLGNAFHAGQESRLAALGISALLNVSCEEVASAEDDEDDEDESVVRVVRTYKRLQVDDNCSSDIGCWFPEAIHFIESAREQQQKVLVHCKAGISRSATICLAYLMWHQHWNLEQAYDFLKAKRRLISPNLNFMRQLLEFEQQLQTSREWENAAAAAGGGGGGSSSEQLRASEELLALSKNGLESAPPSLAHHQATPMCTMTNTALNTTTLNTTTLNTATLNTATLNTATLNTTTLTPHPPAPHHRQQQRHNNNHHHHRQQQQQHHRHHRGPNSNPPPPLQPPPPPPPPHHTHHHCDFGTHPASARPALSLPLTPCGASVVFSFPDTMTHHTPSPPQIVCRSPLLSPS